VLASEGINLTQDQYYTKYLGMDDYDCFNTAVKDAKKSFGKDKIEKMIAQKASLYEEEMKHGEYFVPGVSDFIKAMASSYFLAVVSGALRSEIESILSRAQIINLFNGIVAAGEVSHGKPNPEGFDKGMQILNRDSVASSEFLLPKECLVIEDSIWGIKAARAAGMPCMAVTTSYSEKDLPGAQIYIKDFIGADPQKLFKNL
jgi:HAD superfamily hydrolase (TIGR01509 family)